MKISTELSTDLKKSKWFTEAKGDADGTSYVEIDYVQKKSPSNYGAQALARLQNAEVEFYVGENSKMTVKACHDSARDCDHWMHRVFNAEIEDPSLVSMDYGYTQFYGYLTDLYAYKTGEGPDIEETVEPCYSCGKKHGYVDSHLPPQVFGKNADGSSTGMRLLVRIRIYPTKAFEVRS